MGDMSDLAQGFFDLGYDQGKDEGRESAACDAVLSVAENLRKANPLMPPKDLLDGIFQLLSGMPGITLPLVKEILSKNGVIG